MLESLEFSLNAIIPIVLIVVIGYFLKKKGIINEKFFSYGSKFCFYVALPASLFKSVYTADFSKIDWVFILYCMLFTTVVFFIMILYTKFFCEESKQRGVLIQASFRSNYAYIGIPLAEALFGDASVASLMAAFSIPLYNILSIIALTIFREGEDGKKLGLKECLKGIIKNPLIVSIAIAAALNLSFTGLQNVVTADLSRFIPSMTSDDQSIFRFISKTVLYVAQLATPLSLFVIGGQFTFVSIARLKKQIITGVSIRLVIVPLIAITIGVLAFNFRGQEMATMISLFATPAAVASAIMAQQMDNDGDLANQIVVWSTVFSVITLFIFVFVIKSMGLFSY